MLWLFSAAILGAAAAAAQSDIGHFDIEKVRRAVQQSDTGPAPATSTAEERDSMTAVVLRITLYLGIVVVLIAGVAWFVRKSGLKNPRGGGGAMDIVETLPMGQNRMLVMVRVMDEIFLISQTSSAMTLLDKIGGQKAIDIISSSKGGGTILHFKDAFNGFMGKIRKPA